MEKADSFPASTGLGTSLTSQHLTSGYTPPTKKSARPEPSPPASHASFGLPWPVGSKVKSTCPLQSCEPLGERPMRRDHREPFRDSDSRMKTWDGYMAASCVCVPCGSAAGLSRMSSRQNMAPTLPPLNYNFRKRAPGGTNVILKWPSSKYMNKMSSSVFSTRTQIRVGRSFHRGAKRPIIFLGKPIN